MKSRLVAASTACLLTLSFVTLSNGASKAQLPEETQKALAKWCNPETVKNVTMMAMMGGNGVGSGAYYRYMDKILDGIYVNNMAKADTPEKIKSLTDFVKSSKSYILKNCPG
jgi:hypothetical protein